MHCSAIKFVGQATRIKYNWVRDDLKFLFNFHQIYSVEMDFLKNDLLMTTMIFFFFLIPKK